MKLLGNSWLWFAYFYSMSDKESLVNTNGDKEINLQQGLNGQVSQLPHSPITSTRHTHTQSLFIIRTTAQVILLPYKSDRVTFLLKLL